MGQRDGGGTGESGGRVPLKPEVSHQEVLGDYKEIFNDDSNFQNFFSSELFDRIGTFLKSKNSNNICENIISEIIDNMLGGQDSFETQGDLYQFPKVMGFEKKEQSSLRIMQTNMRGFMSKREVLEKLLCDLSVDILFINETHLKNGQIPHINMYTAFFRHRTRREKGGVAILVKNSLARDAVECFKGEDENECGAWRRVSE